MKWTVVQIMIKSEVARAMENVYSHHVSALSKVKHLIINELMPRLKMAQEAPVTKEEHKHMQKKVTQLFADVKNLRPVAIKLNEQSHRTSHRDTGGCDSVEFRKVLEKHTTEIVKKDSTNSCRNSKCSSRRRCNGLVHKNSKSVLTLEKRGKIKRTVRLTKKPTSIWGQTQPDIICANEVLCLYWNPFALSDSGSLGRSKHQYEETARHMQPEKDSMFKKNLFSYKKPQITCLFNRRSKWRYSDPRLQVNPTRRRYVCTKDLFTLNMLFQKSAFAINLNRFKHPYPQTHWPYAPKYSVIWKPLPTE